MLYFAEAIGEPVADFLGVVFEGAIAAFVGDAALLIEDVEALRPGGVRVVGGVGHFVDAEGDEIFEALGEVVGDGDALRERFRLGVADVVFVFFVGFHLPLVERVGFADVDGEEIGSVFIVVVDLRDIANLATEGRSSEAAEDEDERFAVGAFADVKAGGAVERDERGVGGIAADLQITSVHVRQGVADHADGVFGAAGHDAEADADCEKQDGEGDQGPFEDGVHGLCLLRYGLISEGKVLGCWGREEGKNLTQRTPRSERREHREDEPKSTARNDCATRESGSSGS
jgi:hypothetical protein